MNAGDTVVMGMFTIGMILTHVMLFIAGIVTYGAIAFIYERYFAKRQQHSGVYCERCQQRLSHGTTIATDSGMPLRHHADRAIRRVESRRVNAVRTRPGEHLRVRR